MSDEIAFSSTLRAGKRKLTIQTRFDPTAHKAWATVRDGDEVVDTREAAVDAAATPEQAALEVRQFHDLTLSDLDLLFCVTGKVQEGQNPASLARLGTLFLEKGFYDEAIDTFTAILALDPDYENIHYSLGLAWYRQGDDDRALEELRLAARKRPTYPDVHYMLATILRKKGEHQAAAASCQQALALNADYVGAHLLSGLILAESTLLAPSHPDLPPPIERIKESKQHLLYAMDLVSSEQKEHLARGLECLDLRERLEEGLSEIEKAIEPAALNHRSVIADSEFYLKFMFADLERDNRSLESYIKTLEKAIAQHPEYADLHQSIGTAYLLRGWHSFAHAVEAYRQAVHINPDYQKAQKNLKLLENDGRGFLILLRAILK
ncbi:MAG TPA: tetratricopeptide repeat protein [bacterium]|nr:tetratricopeptide repeat protein [bacterium]